MTDLTPQRFLDELYQGIEGHLNLFCSDRATGFNSITWATEPAQLLPLATELHGDECVWFSAATRLERLITGRGGGDDCGHIGGLWLDVDIAGPAHTKADLPADRAAATKLIRSFPLPPTVVVDTGGGYQAWWLLLEPLPAADAIPLLERWADTWFEYARRQGVTVDNVFDVARIMRLPGTRNTKPGVDLPVVIKHADYSRRYGVDDIDGAMPELPAREPRVEREPCTDPGLPGVAFNNAHTGQDVLRAAGWQFHSHNKTDGSSNFTRPGKNVRDGSSATVYADGHTTIYSDTPGVATRRPMDPFGIYARLYHDGVFEDASAELRKQGYGTPTVDWEWFNRQTKPTEERSEPTVNDGPINWPDFWSHDHPDEEWVIEPLVPRGRGVSLYAPAKEGKSTILLAACAAAATGTSIFGYPAQPARRCMYADYEMTRADLQARLQELGYGPETDLTNLIYWVIPPWAPLDTPEGGAMITAAALQYQAEVVFIDTIGRAVAGDEDKADTLRAYYRCTGQALKREGIAWLRADHSGKNLAKGARGTSAKNDDVDIQWFLKRGQNGITITRTHTRISWVLEKIVLQKREDDNGVVTYEITNERGYAAGTKELADLLDTLNVPITAGKPKAREALRIAGEHAANNALADALRWRKTVRGPLHDPLFGPQTTPPRTATQNTISNGSDRSTDRSGQATAATTDRSVSVGTDRSEPTPLEPTLEELF